MKEIPKKDQPDVAGGAIKPPYPQVPCFPTEPEEPIGPLIPIYDYPAPAVPTT